MAEPLFSGVGVALATLFDDAGELDAKATAGWDPLAHPLQPRRNGTRSAAVTLPPGRRFAFRYLAEGGRWHVEAKDTDSRRATRQDAAQTVAPAHEQYHSRPPLQSGGLQASPTRRTIDRRFRRSKSLLVHLEDLDGRRATDTSGAGAVR